MQKTKIQIDIGEMSSKILVFFIKGCDPGVSNSSADIHICQDTVRIAAMYQKYRNPILSNVTAAKAKMRHFSSQRNNTFVSFHQFPQKPNKQNFDKVDLDMSC